MSRGEKAPPAVRRKDVFLWRDQLGTHRWPAKGTDVSLLRHLERSDRLRLREDCEIMIPGTTGGKAESPIQCQDKEEASCDYPTPLPEMSELPSCDREDDSEK